MRLARPLVLALLAIMLSPSVARADDEQIIVRHRAGLNAAERADIRADAETTLDRRMHLPNTEVVDVEDGTRAEALEELRSDPDVLWAEPDRQVKLAGTSDPYWSILWGLRNDGASAGYTLDDDIDAQQAWTVTRGAGASVAVVDTGVQANHPDLAGRVMAGWDYVDWDSDPSDLHGHGTHVSGIIAAALGNGVGVSGIAPSAAIVPMRVLDANGNGWDSDIADAFYDAGQAGIPVVNASLGGNGTASTAITTAISTHPNTLYVVAAGNDGHDNDTTPTTPCVAPGANVLCVGATTGTDARASFSNYGAATVDLFAPGTYIYSSVPTSAFGYMSGTSQATPYVAGTAALVAASTTKRGADIAAQIKNTVDPVAALGGYSVTGGRLNAARAVGAPVDAPSRSLSVSATGGTNAATISLASPPADLDTVTVYDSAFTPLATTTDSSFTVTGLPAGLQTLTVMGRFDDATTSQAKSVSVAVAAPPHAPTPAPVTPVQERPGTAGLPTTTTPTVTPSSVSGVQIVRRGGRRSLLFRVTGTARITVTLLKLQGGRYRKTSSKTVRMAAGLQSLPITSRLLGMRVPRGRWQVTVGTGAAVATVAFTRR